MIALQGARQTGKSVLAKELLTRRLKTSEYITLDSAARRSAATERPETFLQEHREADPLIIDEAQKAPPLFDAIKVLVDESAKPGQFLLLGSTEFSHLSRVRESLTGRLGRIRILPLTLRESLKMKAKASLSRAELMTYLSRGGMPGILGVRLHSAREQLFQDWIDLTCERDILQIAKFKLDPSLARSILGLTATLEDPSQAEIARNLRTNTRKVENHLIALMGLFAIHRIDPHPSGGGKPIFIPLDTGIATFLGAKLTRQLQVWLLNERLANSEYKKSRRSQFYFYRSLGKRFIHLIERNGSEELAFEIHETESPGKLDSFLMSAFLKKNKNSMGQVLAPVTSKTRIEGVDFVPWEVASF